MNNETYEFEDRKYVNPTVSRDEQLAFVDNLRNTHNAEMQKIVQDTHNLGTDVPSNLGGLNGATGVWGQQYVEPRVNSMISGLKATARAEALSEVLSNYQNQMQKRYKDAYRAAQKRENDKSNSSNSGNGTTLNDGSIIVGDGSGDPMTMEEVTDENATDDEIDKEIANVEFQLKQTQRLYDQTLKERNINGDRGSNFFDYIFTPAPDYGDIQLRDRQVERKNKIMELNKRLTELKSKKGK